MDEEGREREREEDDDSMEPKRKKLFTVGEVLQKIEKNNKKNR